MNIEEIKEFIEQSAKSRAAANTSAPLTEDIWPVPAYADGDLAQIVDGASPAWPLRLAAFELIAFSLVEPGYLWGRFEFCSGSQSAAANRLAFRLCRQALDFLEQDFLACEDAEMEDFRRELKNFAALKEGKVPDSVNVIVPCSKKKESASDGDLSLVSTDALISDSNAPDLDPERYAADLALIEGGDCPSWMGRAATDLANLVLDGTQNEWQDVSSPEDVVAQCAALRVLQRAVAELSDHVTWQVSHRADWLRKSLEAIETAAQESAI